MRLTGFVGSLLVALRGDENVVEAISICDATPGPVARLVKTAILNRDNGRDRIREAIEEAGLVEVPRLEEKLNLLATIAQIAPLLGLLGTILGFMEIFQQQFSSLTAKVSSCSVTDAVTKQTLFSVYNEHNYLCDPHGAVAYRALEDYLQLNPTSKGIFLETAHPVKFYDVVEPIIGQTVEVPDSIKDELTKEKKSTLIGVGVEELKKVLMKL